MIAFRGYKLKGAQTPTKPDQLEDHLAIIGICFMEKVIAWGRSEIRGK